MTDLTDTQQEAIEHAHHAGHAAESGDPLMIQVTLSIAVMSVIAAFIGALGETEASHTFVEKNDAVLAQAKASDTWAEYQSESVKRHIYTVGSTLTAQPEAADKMKSEVDKYAKEQPDTQAKAKAFEADVERHNGVAEHHFERHHILTIAEGIVHVAVAGASIALLAHKRHYWLIALGLTGIGMAVAVTAYIL
jgi:hypothetical protein